MRIGPNMQRSVVFVVAFLAAQGMVYRWGYDVGYFSGQRQGYGDVLEEARSKAWSERVMANDQSSQTARAAGPQALAVAP